MARHKNIDWNLSNPPKNSDGSQHIPHGDVHAALLMDIRDELQALRRVFECANFLGIPFKLDTIAANTKKPTRRKKK